MNVYQLMMAEKLRAAHDGVVYTAMRDTLIVERDEKKKYLTADTIHTAVRKAKKRAGSRLDWTVIE